MTGQASGTFWALYFWWEKKYMYMPSWPRSGLYDANTLARVLYVRKMVLTPFVNFPVTLAESSTYIQNFKLYNIPFIVL